MSLLDDARQLVITEPTYVHPEVVGRICRYCRGESDGEGRNFRHEPKCPWLSMPKIVAALEAAQAASECLDEGVRTAFKGVCIENARYLLRTALKGEPS
jgi:hypothetical protein